MRVAFNDLMLNLCLCIFALFAISFILIAAKNKQEGVKNKAEIAITLIWDASYTSDVDLWVQDPRGINTWYSQKEAGICHLDRDDLGMSNDTVILADGSLIKYEYNQEIAAVRGIIPGEWIIAVHMFRLSKDEEGGVPYEVKVEDLNPTIKTVYLHKGKLTQRGEEHTIGRLMITGAGEVLDIDKTPKPIIEMAIRSHQPASSGRSWGRRPEGAP